MVAAASHQQHHDFFIYHGQHRQTDHELWKRLFVGFDAAVNVLSDYTGYGWAFSLDWYIRKKIGVAANYFQSALCLALKIKFL